MDQLLARIDGFLAKHKMSESQFGIDALNDKNFVPQLRDGRDIRFGTAAKVIAFMDAHEQDAAA